MSDNGPNFAGADPELRGLFHESSEFYSVTCPYLTMEGTRWLWNPPGAPHFGGIWEAGVKSTKFHLRRIIGESVLTYSEMATLLSRISACLNSVITSYSIHYTKLYDHATPIALPPPAPAAPPVIVPAVSGLAPNTSFMLRSLQPLSIPEFSGASSDWAHFRDIFLALINDQDYPKVLKLAYLKKYLKGEALAVISQINVSDENYEAAWNLLSYLMKTSVVSSTII